MLLIIRLYLVYTKYYCHLLKLLWSSMWIPPGWVGPPPALPTTAPPPKGSSSGPSTRAGVASRISSHSTTPNNKYGWGTRPWSQSQLPADSAPVSMRTRHLGSPSAIISANPSAGILLESSKPSTAKRSCCLNLMQSFSTGKSLIN